MTKISNLPQIVPATLTGEEDVPIVKGGATGRAKLGDLAQPTIDEANNAKAAAQASADAAAAWAAVGLSTNDIYPSAADGIAATVDGQYFAAEGIGGVLATVYRNDAGAATEVGSFQGTARDNKARRHISPVNLEPRGRGLRLRKALADIRSGQRKTLRILAVGDSLVGVSWSTPPFQMLRLFGPQMGSSPVYGYEIGAGANPYKGDSPTFSGIRGNPYTPGGRTTGEIRQKTDYDIAWDGSCVVLDAAGEIATYSNAVNGVGADYLYIPAVTEPGAGSFKVEIANAATSPAVGDAAWRSPTSEEIASAHALTGSELIVSADAAFGVDIVELTVGMGRWHVRFVHASGGAVRTMNPMFEVRTAAAVNVWNIGQASNDFTTALQTSEPINAALIAAYDPDVIMVCSDDRLAAYQNFLPLLESARAASGLAHLPDVVLVGNPYYSNTLLTDQDIIERIEYCWEFVEGRVGWDQMDGMAFSSGLEESARAGFVGDGIHFSDEIAWQMTKRWAESRGLIDYAFQRPGGDASAADILQNKSNRLLTAQRASSIVLQSLHDTGTMTWAFKGTGGGAGVRNPASIRINTGAAAGASCSAHIAEANTPMGLDQGGLRHDVRGMTTTAKVPSGVSADYWAFIGCRSEAWDSVANGDLVGGGADYGFGFRFSNGLVEGVCIDGNQNFAVSEDSIPMVTGGPADWVQLTAIITPRTVNLAVGMIEWFVDGVKIGESTLYHSTMRPPRGEIMNQAAAENYILDFSPPRLLTESAAN